MADATLQKSLNMSEHHDSHISHIVTSANKDHIADVLLQ